MSSVSIPKIGVLGGKITGAVTGTVAGGYYGAVAGAAVAGIHGAVAGTVAGATVAGVFGAMGVGAVGAVGTAGDVITTGIKIGASTVYKPIYDVAGRITNKALGNRAIVDSTVTGVGAVAAARDFAATNAAIIGETTMFTKLAASVAGAFTSKFVGEMFNPDVLNKSSQGSMPNLSAFFQGQYRFEVFIQKPSDTDLKAIDDFFESYGYNVSMFATPKLDVRDNFTYVKTRDSVVTGQCPYEAIQQLQTMLDNGCKFWKGEIGNN